MIYAKMLVDGRYECGHIVKAQDRRRDKMVPAEIVADYDAAQAWLKTNAT